VAFIALVITALASSEWRKFAGLMFITGAPAVLGLFVESATPRLILLESSSFLALLLIAKSAKTKSATRTFLTVVLASAATLIPGLLLLEHGRAGMARTLLIAGFFLKLGLVPFFLWLPKVAEQVPALVLGLVICVLDIAAFGELCLIAKTAPWVLETKGLWLGVAAFSAVTAALLMLGQRKLKRLLALSTAEDIGFLCFGLAATTAIGYEGALIGAATHAVAKALLFISISSPEAAGELRSTQCRGLASRYPVSAAGFLIGMLAVLGIPPTLGFAGRWRIYETATQMGTGWLVLLIVSSMLALIAYVRALTGMWWGPSSTEVGADAVRMPETWIAKACIVFLAVLLVVSGALPVALNCLRGIR
jgi:NADH:ubiquinone oxidoreductase subunit 2 (subunit N)